MLETATSTGTSSRTISRRATLTHLGWTGPVTVALNLFAVTVLQRLALAVLPPGSAFMTAVLTSKEPGILTAGLVTAGVTVFAVCVLAAAEPVRLYRRIAFGVLLLSVAPNVAVPLLMPSALDWKSSATLMAMHVAVWAITVGMLTRVAVRYDGTRSEASTSWRFR